MCTHIRVAMGLTSWVGDAQAISTTRQEPKVLQQLEEDMAALKRALAAGPAGGGWVVDQLFLEANQERPG